MDNLLQNIKEIRSMWERIVRLMTALEKREKEGFNDPFLAANEINEIKNALEKIKNVDGIFEVIRGTLGKYSNAVELLEKSATSIFADKLDKLLKPNGVGIKGNIPNLHYKNFTIKVESGKVVIYYGPEQEILNRFPLDSQKVAQYLHAPKIGSDLSPEIYLSSLKQAYDRAKMTGEEKVKICSVLTELVLLLQLPVFKQNPTRDNFIEYRRADFSFDLARVRGYFLSKGISPLPFELSVATKAFAKSRKDFLWIADSDTIEGRIYSHIKI